MKKITIHASQPYSILLGEDNLKHMSEYLEESYSSILIITDQHVEKLYLKKMRQCLAVKDNVYTAIISPGETSKSIDTFFQLHTKAIQFGLDRKSLIIALGGGVVGDLAGFVASTYMRGIDYIQVPTTILAHDSSVGGKVAINHPLGKNLIGSFYTPKLIVYDVTTLQSLSPQQIRSGYAELVKEALLVKSDFLDTLLSYDIYELRNTDLIQHLYQGILVKAQIVEADEKEKDIRQFLNLGHTLGHALEQSLGYGTMSHGEAVAVGILFAMYVSEKQLDADLPRIELFQWFYSHQYPLKVETVMIEDLVQSMKNDKKTVNKQVQMVLLKEIGNPIVQQIDDSKLSQYLYSFLKWLNKA